MLAGLHACLIAWLLACLLISSQASCPFGSVLMRVQIFPETEHRGRFGRERRRRDCRPSLISSSQDHLLYEFLVGKRACAIGGVVEDVGVVRVSFFQADILGYHGLEHERAEVLSKLLLDILRYVRAIREGAQDSEDARVAFSWVCLTLSMVS